MNTAMKAAGFGSCTPDDAGLDEQTLECHRKRIHAHHDNNVFPGFAEGVVVDGKVAYLDLCGFTDKGRKSRMTERTLFRGYSMMKPITATAFMSLVDEGLLTLDDPVSRYVPSFQNLQVRRKSGKGLEPMKRQMTLRHLLMHTSGLGYGPGSLHPRFPLIARTEEEKLYKDIAVRQENGEIDTLGKLVDALAVKPLLFQPGSDYAYGMSMDVLGYVMELVAGQPLKNIIRNRVLSPAGMCDACWTVPRSAAHKICGYYRLMRDAGSVERWLERLDGAKAVDSMYIHGSTMSYAGTGKVPAAGGLWGAGRSSMLFSMRDVLLFCHMLLNSGCSLSGKRVLKAATVASLLRNWFELKRAADKPQLPRWESDDVGWSPLGNIQLTGPHKGALFMGGMSYFWLDPRRKIAAAIMTETYWQVSPHGWKDSLDNLEEVLAEAVQAASQKRKAEGAANRPAKRKR
eukprot:TRINITY_DN15190_c0_g1_i1.p1 TRINITY_DN15190_c0_g1~~TRINITY_DN15190_c0_g1_i1.p1  ORF type:complete len:458 (+),score=69.04 TRINITY_DN15190_c0_g1_i1:85-1458(+)